MSSVPLLPQSSSGAAGSGSIMPVNPGFENEDLDDLDDADGSDLDDVLDESPDLVFLPFQAIREYPSILNSKTIFLKDEPVDVRIVNVERTTRPLFHPNIYEIEIKHAGYYWSIRRRYTRIHNLHRRLRLHALSMRLTRKRTLDTLTSDLRPRLPRLPKKMEVFVTADQVEERRVKVEKFLRDLLSVSLWREHPETLRFLEVSSLSFMGELGEKGKEMTLRKLSGRVRMPLPCLRDNLFCDVLSRWKERWILVKDTYYAYMSTHSNRIANVLLIDRDIRIEHDARYSARHKSVVVKNSTRDLVVKFGSQRDLNDWLKYFEYVISTSAAQFVKPHPHGSSFPVRDDIPAKWFIDGAPYMSAVADELEKAQEEIFITDWWLSPEIYMKRPITEGEKWRLDRILQRKAEAGVKVYVMLYKEVPIALGINSFYSKATLTKRHPNIKCQRHPDHIGQNTVFLWSHHEKTVIIDQKVAFLGGIDLCYGRWDDHLYRLTDTGPIDGDITKESAGSPAIGKEDLSVTPQSSGLSRPKEDAAPEEVELMKRASERDTRSSVQIQAGKWRMGQKFKAHNESDDVDKPDHHREQDFMDTVSSSKTTQTNGQTGASEPLSGIRNGGLAAENGVSPVSPPPKDLASLVQAMQRKKPEEKITETNERTGSSGLWSGVRNNGLLPRENRGDPAMPPPKDLASIVQAVYRKNPEQQNFSRTAATRRSVSMPAGGTVRIKSETKDDGIADSVRIGPFVKKDGDRPGSPKFRKRTKMLQNAMRMNRSLSQRDAVDTNVRVYKDDDDGKTTEADLDKLNIKVAGRLWLGKDYANEVRKAFAQDGAAKPYDDLIDRSEIPRMPWRDVGAVVYEQAARDVARHFIQRWNASKVEKNRHDENYSFLLPKSYDTADVDREQLHDTHRCRVQLLRSCCTWSAGLQPNKVEDSIHQAYISCIEQARHFIYIELLVRKGFFVEFPFENKQTINVTKARREAHLPQEPLPDGPTVLPSQEALFCLRNKIFPALSFTNQFFITLDGDSTSGVSNRIGEALFQRIKRAFENRENFRVFVVMPMKPGIEGEYGTDRGAAVQAVTHWNYRSICRGGKSLHERLEKIGADPAEYLTFCGLRTYGELEGKLVTELIYVHSKVMVVDDLYSIIGSANVNDRSMLGTRDSELAILVKDRDFDESVMDGKPFQSGKFSGRFRRRLMKISLGVWNEKDADTIVGDCVSKEFFHGVWNATATKNEKIYEEVFACLPSDAVFDFITLSEWEKKEHKCQTDPDEARDYLKQIKGYLTRQSLQFLKDVDLEPTFKTRESYLPSYFWT